MTRRLAHETRALRLAERMEATGRKVARVIIDGERVEVVLETGETKKDPYEAWKRAREAAGNS